jgi:hypothetical protein
MARTSTVSPTDAAGTPIFAALSQPVRTRSNCLPQHQDGMQARPTAIDPLRLRGFAAPAIGGRPAAAPAHQQQVDRRREDDDSK